jgi:hypothetical protein
MAADLKNISNALFETLLSGTKYTVDLAEEGTIHRIRGTLNTNSSLNFSFWTDTGGTRNCVYFWEARAWSNETAVVQNNNNGAWGAEERVSLTAARITAGQPFTFYLLMTTTSFTWTFEDFTPVYTFNNRMVGVKSLAIEYTLGMTVQRLILPANVGQTARYVQ